MCDYSLQHAKSRPAAVGDKLTVKSFGMGTYGFACQNDPALVVCVLPGTELAFDGNLSADRQGPAIVSSRCDRILLTFLAEGQVATVLQLPTAPRSEAEAQEQSRLEVVG
jgi:hypothetical protein